MRRFYEYRPDHEGRVARYLVPLASPTLADRGRFVWCVLVRAVSKPQVALWASAITNLAVLYGLYKTMQVMHSATCVIGGEDLTKCLR